MNLDQRSFKGFKSVFPVASSVRDCWSATDFVYLCQPLSTSVTVLFPICRGLPDVKIKCVTDESCTTSALTLIN